MSTTLPEPAPGWVRIPPCPFCHGPPKPVVISAECPYGGEIDEADITESGVFAKAYVFCHECGAEGPAEEGDVYNMEDVRALERRAVENWTNRDDRHRRLYDAGDEEGLNFYPRSDDG